MAAGPTLYLAMSAEDARWLIPRLEVERGPEDVVAAPTFDARTALDAAGVKARSFEAQSWAMDRIGLFDAARRLAGCWHEGERMASALEAVRECNGYPLVSMHFARLGMLFFELLQAADVSTRLLNAVRPARVVAARRGDPFSGPMLSVLTGAGGTEREVLPELAAARGVAVELVDPPQAVAETSAARPARKVTARGVASRAGIAAATVFGGALRTLRGCRGHVVVGTWPGFYTDQILNAVKRLASSGTHVTLVADGRGYKPKERVRLEACGLRVVPKEFFHSTQDAVTEREWRARGKTAADAVRTAVEGGALAEAGIPSSGVLADLLATEVAHHMPATAVSLGRTERLLDALSPDLMLVQFARLAEECAMVLPARRRGIPTVLAGHGVPGAANIVRDTFCARHYAMPGRASMESLQERMACPPGTLHEVGDSRLETLVPSESGPDAVRREKLRQGFDPDRPVCVFCDSSGFSQVCSMWRHSTRAALHDVLALRRSMPELQVVYRVHHGIDASLLREHVHGLGDPDLRVQISPDPSFDKVVRAADVVVSNPTSAVTEALLCGVRVVYYRNRGYVEPTFARCEAVTPADSVAELCDAVAAEVARPMTREAVRAMAEPYLKWAVAGGGEGSSERLAGLIGRLMERAEGDGDANWNDWLERIRTACAYETKLERVGKGETDGG